MNLQSQGEAMRSVKMNDSNNTNCKYEWLSMLIDLPPSVLKFGMNGTLNTLPTANNLTLWKIKRKMPDGNKIVKSHCLSCGHDNARLGRVLCYCDFILNNGLFNPPKWRHDRVLTLLIDLINPFLKEFQLYCDLPSHQHYYESLPLVNSNLRPDIILINGNNLIIGELTCPMESSLSSCHREKESKYYHLSSLFYNQGFVVTICAFEIIARGLIADSLVFFLNQLEVTKQYVKLIVQKLSLMVPDCSFKIFINRDNKERTNIVESCSLQWRQLKDCKTPNSVVIGIAYSFCF
ncbi:hypothetical protein RCL1_008849 [Eukaryota sp. TZLM3-RCL]